MLFGASIGACYLDFGASIGTCYLLLPLELVFCFLELPLELVICSFVPFDKLRVKFVICYLVLSLELVICSAAAAGAYETDIFKLKNRVILLKFNYFNLSLRKK